MSVRPKDLLTCAEMRALGLHAPRLLVELEALHGADAVRRLVAAAGGLKIKLPTGEAVEASVIAERCGADVAAFLAARLGPGEHDIPLGPRAARAQTVAAVRAALRRGESVQSVAAQLGVTRRNVTRIRASLLRAGAVPAAATDANPR